MTNKETIIESYEVKEYNNQKRINLRSNAKFTKGAKVVIIDYDTYITNLDNNAEKQASKINELTNQINELTETNAELLKRLNQYKEDKLADTTEITKLNKKLADTIESKGSKEITEIAELKTKVNYLHDINESNAELYNNSINSIVTLAEVIIEKNTLELVSNINETIKGTNFIKRALGFTIKAEDIEADTLKITNTEKLNESKPVLKIATKDELDKIIIT